MRSVDFSWIDYSLFALMFGLSGAVGIYFGCFGKQSTATDYLHGGRQMKVFPVAMSLVASTLSGVSLLGIPAEVYMHGSQYWMMAVSIFFVGFTMNYIFLPVYHKLQLMSIFEYLEMRFDKNIRTIASIFFTVGSIFSLPVVIYAPSLAFNQVTGFDVHLIAPAMALICIFYTAIGGMKAVVWTDTLQFSVTLCTLGCVLVMGTISVGGVSVIWEKARLGDRLEFFNMDLDPTVRSTFWTIVVGNLFVWTGFVGTTPGNLQRFMAVPTLNDARKILIVFVIFTIITKSISCFSGLIMYAKYMDCDPLTAGYMEKADQILPYYVLDVAAQIPGLSGLFVAGLFSTALSTLSTFLNALSGTMYADFIAPFMPADISQTKISTIMKLLTVLIGLISVSLIFVVERLGSVLQLILTLAGITGGPVLGLYLLGMLFPIANRKGALYGIIVGVLFMSTVITVNQIHIWKGTIQAIAKPLYTYGCNITSSSLFQTWNETTVPTTTTSGECPQEKPFWLFRISFYYMILIGSVVVVAVGLLISLLTKDVKQQVNLDLVSPIVHRFLEKSHYKSVEKALHELKIAGSKEESKEWKDPSTDKLLKR